MTTTNSKRKPRVPKALGKRSHETAVDDVRVWLEGFHSIPPERRRGDDTTWIQLKLSCTRQQADRVLEWYHAAVRKEV